MNHGIEKKERGTANEKQFHVSCEAGAENRFSVGTESLSVTVSQRIRRDGREEMWSSVGVFAEKTDEETLVIRVFVFSPGQDEPLQIARIESRPKDDACLTPLVCKLHHVASSASDAQRSAAPRRTA